jgi:hypothetical protein
LDEAYDKLDSSQSLRPTIIHLGPSWSKSSQKVLLAKSELKTLNGEDQDKEKRIAFDLLDALTKSGGLDLENVSMHVVIAATHTFENSLMDCLVQDNINPIELMEKSALIMNSVLYDCQPPQILVERR